MAEALILEFDGVGREQYDAINERLGIDPNSGQGDWPDGLLSHIPPAAERATAASPSPLPPASVHDLAERPAVGILDRLQRTAGRIAEVDHERGISVLGKAQKAAREVLIADG